MGKADSFDIFEYAVPQGWKKSDMQGGVMLAQQTERSFGAIFLYASQPASADALQNFKGEWLRLVQEPLGITDEPQVETGPKKGAYENVAGGAAGSSEGVSFVVLLSSFTGNGRVASVLYLTTDQAHLELFDRFNNALKLGPPKTDRPKPPAGALAKTLSTPTTRFDDGWVATVQNDHVRLDKGGLAVFLYYALPAVGGDQADIVQHYWKQVVASRYRADELKVFQNGPCYLCLYFGESGATEVATGAHKHVALFVQIEQGKAYPILAVASSFAVFQQSFPNIEALGKMSGYNRFAVKLPDLVGTWTSHEAVGLNYYNALTGAYAGMNMVNRSDEFTFNRDGTYSSKHVGSSGFIGSQSILNQRYTGKATLTDWRITLTGRYKGSVEAYHAYFIMTAGGPVLQLVQVGAEGIRYTLARQKSP
jgi:hypothetical protein